MSDLASADPAPAPTGKRAINKADKLGRIREAARSLFVEKGYDGTVLRDVAARSGVGFGTLFDYASNKRDLLFLVFNPDLHAALSTGYEYALGHHSFLDQIMEIFGRYYETYFREPNISRYILRELNFYSDGAQATVFMEQRATFLARLRDLAQAAQSSGKLRTPEPPELISQILFSVFAWEVRRWLGTDPLDLPEGLAHLRRILTLQIYGFAPSET